MNAATSGRTWCEARRLCAIRCRPCLYETGANTNLCMRSPGDFRRAGPRELEPSPLRRDRHDRSGCARHAYVARCGADRVAGLGRRAQCVASHQCAQRAHGHGAGRPGSSLVSLPQAAAQRRADREARLRRARRPLDPVGTRCSKERAIAAKRSAPRRRFCRRSAGSTRRLTSSTRASRKCCKFCVTR